MNLARLWTHGRYSKIGCGSSIVTTRPALPQMTIYMGQHTERPYSWRCWEVNKSGQTVEKSQHSEENTSELPIFMAYSLMIGCNHQHANKLKCQGKLAVSLIWRTRGQCSGQTQPFRSDWGWGLKCSEKETVTERKTNICVKFVQIAD